MAKALPAFMLKGREDDMAMANMQGGTEEALAEIEKQKELRAKREKAKIWIKDLQKFYISPYLTCGKYAKCLYFFLGRNQLTKSFPHTIIFLST